MFKRKERWPGKAGEKENGRPLEKEKSNVSAVEGAQWVMAVLGNEHTHPAQSTSSHLNPWHNGRVNWDAVTYQGVLANGIVAFKRFNP